MRGILALIVLVLFAATASAQINTTPLRVDNSDGCGDERMSVEAGRDVIRRDRSYTERGVWFQDRLAKLQKCVDEIPKRRAAATAAKQRWDTSTTQQLEFATSTLLLVFAVGLPFAILLSYAQSAGVAGNGALVRWRDWKGSPMFIWGALAVSALLYQEYSSLLQSTGYRTRDFQIDIGKILLLFSAVGALIAAGVLTAGFIFKDLWSTLKGIFVLGHYMVVRHPAQPFLPTSPTTAIARRDFGRAIREHGIGLKGFWVELATPSFVRRHKLERAGQVQAQLHADTSILKAAMERESARAAHDDRRGRP
jgi:hypothetical protein